MKQLAFFIDVDKCIFCHSCTFACANENNTGEFRRRNLIKIPSGNSLDEIQFSMSCNHCETPACMTVCSRNCIRKLRNGIVILDSENCNGCKKCVSVCPFSAISVNPYRNKADKCDMCYKRQQRGDQPVCIEACIADAITIRDISQEYPSNYKSTLKEYSMKTITNPSTRFKYERREKTRIWARKGDSQNESSNI